MIIFLALAIKIFNTTALISAYTEDTVCVGVARLGLDSRQIVAGTLRQLSQADLGPPLHSLVVTGHTHPLEMDMLRHFALDPRTFAENG